MMERFTGKVALVTGAGTGIGRAVAQRYAAEGAQVLIVGRTEATLSETASASENISYIVADIEKSNEVERIVSRIKEKYGRLDVLVNNAGWAPVTPITKVTLQEYDKAFSINVRALLDMTIQCLPLLMESKGNIINMSSVIVANGVQNMSVYAGTKGAVEMFTKVWAKELAKTVRVNRPGPMDSIPKFIEWSQHPEKIKYKHESLRPILAVTYGCIVYQEQVIEIFRSLAGFSLGQADNIRRAMSKKKHKVIDAERIAFVHGDESRGIDGAVKRGIPEDTANSIYDEILDFVSYAFNKAHAVSYAIVVYRTAYMKRHYPQQYMAALLTSILDSSAKVAEYIAECREIGIKLLPPDVNASGANFTVEGQNIRYGLVAIKGIGWGAIDSLVQERTANGPFQSFEDFCRRMSGKELNRRAIENLIKAGAFDSMGYKRRALLEVAGSVLDSIAQSLYVAGNTLQLALCAVHSIDAAAAHSHIQPALSL